MHSIKMTRVSLTVIWNVIRHVQGHRTCFWDTQLNLAHPFMQKTVDSGYVELYTENHVDTDIQNLSLNYLVKPLSKALLCIYTHKQDHISKHYEHLQLDAICDSHHSTKYDDNNNKHVTGCESQLA